jgi:hypothetical protein
MSEEADYISFTRIISEFEGFKPLNWQQLADYSKLLRESQIQGAHSDGLPLENYYAIASSIWYGAISAIVMNARQFPATFRIQKAEHYDAQRRG